MFIIEWYSKYEGYSHALVSSLADAHLISAALRQFSANFQVSIQQVGNGCTGANIK
jgi:hypothetical protein